MTEREGSTAQTETAVGKVVKPSPLPSELHLSSGLLVRVKRVPPMLLADIIREIPRPEPPTMWIEDLGRNEANPSDPDYLDRVQTWEAQIAMAMADCFLLMGVEILELPEGIPDPKTTTWTKKFKALGRPVSSDPDLRRLLWLKYVALSDDDLKMVMGAVGQLSMVKEGDVAKATDLFRGKTRR